MSLPHIRSYSDLVTPEAEIKKGFLNQALKKTQAATPYVRDAKNFWKALQGIRDVEELMSLTDYKANLISASGFSEKANSHFSDEEINDSVKIAFKKLCSKSPEEFREEALFRYLLTKGDSLGGEMRNWTGEIAGTKMIESLLMALSQKRNKLENLQKNRDKIRSISWSKRVLLFNSTPKIIGKNIDLILLNDPNGTSKSERLLATPSAYIACGERKGGIDPAGADEHWKTAKGALDNIRRAFSKADTCPQLFFVGAAIEESMANEIFTQLEQGKLSYAANLTVPVQVSDLCLWLVSL